MDPLSLEGGGGGGGGVHACLGVLGELENTGDSQSKKRRTSSSDELVSEEQLEAYTPEQPMLQNGQDAKSLIPGPDIPPDDNFLKVLGGLLSENKQEAMMRNHLLSIGWKLCEDNSELRVCSPDGSIKLNSLAEACRYLTLSSLEEINTYSSSESSAKGVDDDPGVSTELVGDDSRVGINPEYCPQAVTDWYNLALADKRQVPRSECLKAKQHLLAVGWRLKYITKVVKNKSKRELRYISPKNRSYSSLVRACEVVMKETAGSTSLQPTAASHGMQSQVHNQGQSQISLQNQSQARQQLLSQNVQNTIVNAGVQSSASLPPALPFVTSLNQISMPNSAGQRINMQSRIAQNFVGNSVSQGVPSNIVSKTQGRQKLRQFASQKQQQQLRHQTLKQKLPGNIQSSVMQQQQALQQPQNLLQPTQMSNVVGRSTNMQSNSVSYSVSQGIPSNIFSNSQYVSQQPHQIPSSSLDSEAHEEQNAVDWQEETYRKFQDMKGNCFTDLNDMYHKVSIKCQQHDNSGLNVPESHQIEELKTWKRKLESIIHSFYVSKNEIVHDMENKYLADLNYLYHGVSIKCQQHDDSVLNGPKSTQIENLKSWKVMLESIIHPLYVSKNNFVPGMKEKLSTCEKQIIIQQPGGHPLSMQPQQQPQQQLQQQEEQQHQLPDNQEALSETSDASYEIRDVSETKAAD